MESVDPMLKRRIVQHGPSTLTISLPIEWTKLHDLHRGDDILLVSTDRGLLLTSDKGQRYDQRRINVSGLHGLIPRVVAALYKRGYDDLIIEYTRPEELEQIHEILARSCLGFEIVGETEGEVHIRNVSEPSQEEFRALFRRIFYFLLSIADEGLTAAKVDDRAAYHKLVLRDQNVNKLSDFCRRLVHKRKQREYASEMALYHVIEQLEKIADRYGALNTHLRSTKRRLSERTLQTYAEVNTLVRAYEQLFFDFDLARTEELAQKCRVFLKSIENDRNPSGEDQFAFFQLEAIATDVYDLIGATLVLHA